MKNPFAQKEKPLLQENMHKFMESKNPSCIARLGAFGPKLWYDCHFDASKLWEGVEVNSLGASIVWGSMFAHYDTRQALAEIQCPICLALGRYD